jgi:beta-catenin-like protein 1
LKERVVDQGTKKKKTTTATPASEDTSHTLGILSSLFSNLPSDSASRVRLLAKFVEANYEKVDKLLEFRDSATARLDIADQEIEREKEARSLSCPIWCAYV